MNLITPRLARHALPRPPQALLSCLTLGGVFVLFAWLVPPFLQWDNLRNIVDGSALLLILALGMTLIVAIGGIDLSVCIAFDMGAAFAIVALKDYQLAWYLAVLAGIAGGVLVGLLNALLVVRLSISPFLATLGTFFIGSSVQRIFTHGGGPISFREAPLEFQNLAVGVLGGVPVKVWLAGAVLLVYFVLLERSILGQRIHAIGMQKSAAQHAGMRVGAIVFAAFVFASATCALGGTIASANMQMFTPMAGHAYLLNAIAAVFIGASLRANGRPHVLGTLLGTLFLGMVANGFNLMGLEPNEKAAAAGLVLLLALSLSAWQQRRR